MFTFNCSFQGAVPIVLLVLSRLNCIDMELRGKHILGLYSCMSPLEPFVPMKRPSDSRPLLKLI
jgi:hypothetical protein